MKCPNKSHPDWIELADKLGEDGAYLEYYKNGLETPDPSAFNNLKDSEKVKFEEIQEVPEFPVAGYEEWQQSQVKDSIKNFLRANDISYESVEAITDSNGNPLPANAIADMIAKAVRVVQGYESVEILGEEAGHFLVELLGEDSPLYQSMMSEIENYDLYQEVLDRYGSLPDYKANPTKLKKEAVGQMIGKMLANSFEDSNTQREERVGRWWNRVLRYLKDRAKSLLGIQSLENSVVQYNPFSQAAQIILNERELSSENLENSTETFYSANLQLQDKIVNDITTKHTIIPSETPGGGYTRNVGDEIVDVPNRVTDRVERSRRFDKERTDVEKAIDEIKAKYGTAGHADIQNILLRLIAERNGTPVPTREHSLPEDVYNTLEKHFTKFYESFPADSVLLPEVTLYDPRENEAGTVDLVVVHNDGSVSIYDWKFIDFNNKKEISFYKRQGWEIQLPRYKEILRKEYGVTQFRQLRVIPISAKYKGKELKGIQIGDVDINKISEDLEHLLPVPMFEEMTGVESLDKLLLTLLKEKDEWSNKRYPQGSTPEQIDAFRANKTTQLKRIQKAIENIQRKHDITEYIEMGEDLIRTLQSGDLSSYTPEEILDLLENKLKRYAHETISIVADLNEDVATKELKEKIKTLAANAQAFETHLQAEKLSRIVNLAGENALNPIKDKTWWDRNMLSISKQADPLIRSFWNLVKRSKENTKKELDKFIDEVSKIREELIAENPNAGSDLYDFMIRTSPKGEITVVNKFNSEIYDRLEEKRKILRDSNATKAQKQAAKQWIKDNTTFDKEAYNLRYKTLELALRRLYNEYANKDQLIQERLEDYKNKYSDNDLGLSHHNNYNIKIKDIPSNYSDAYKVIAASPAKLKFYNMWMERNKQFLDLTGVDKQGTFIWNVPNNLTERITENGLGAILDFNSMGEQLRMKEGDRLGMIDPATGKPLFKVPVYFSNLDRNEDGTVDTSNQSRNLASVLLTVGAMAYNHKHMSEIEGNSQLLRSAVKDRETLRASKNGGVIRNPDTDAVEKGFNSSKDLEQFEDYLNYYVYGVSLKTPDAEFKLFGKPLSRNATILGIRNWYVAKALGLNPVSIVANAVAGKGMALMTGADGRLYKNSDFLKAANFDLPLKDKTSYMLIGMADLLDREDTGRKIRKATSYNALTKHLTFDNIFIGQRTGDWWLRNAVLVAMAKNYKVENGNIVRNGKAKNKESPSLYQVFTNNTNEADGKLNLEGVINDNQFEGFVNAVQATTDTILGNSTRDDVNTLRLTILGRAFLTFRSWVGNLYEARWGIMKYNEELDLHTKGRYMSLLGSVFNKKVVPLMWDTVKATGAFGISGKVGNSTIEHAKMLYADTISKNPELEQTLTEEDFIEMHIANMKSSLAEAYVYLSVIGMLMLLRGDEDEPLEQGSFRKYAFEQTERIKLEIANFWNIPENIKLINSPLPMINIYGDIKRLGYTLFEAPYLIATGEADQVRPHRAVRTVTSQIPMLNGIERTISFTLENYDKALKDMD